MPRDSRGQEPIEWVGLNSRPIRLLCVEIRRLSGRGQGALRHAQRLPKTLAARDSALPLSTWLDYRDAAMNARHNPSGSPRIAGPRGTWVLVAAGLVAVPANADAAHVKGRFDGFRLLQNPVWAEAKDPKNHGYSFREPVPTVRAEFRRPFPHIPKELCLAAIAGRRTGSTAHGAYRMPLYPLPPLLGLAALIIR